MSPRTARIIVAVIGIALGLSLTALPDRPSLTAAQDARDVLAYRERVQATAHASWLQQPSGASGEHVAALVQLDHSPLGLVGKGWGHERRAAYAAELAAAQDDLSARVTAMGGTVVARFSHAAAGVAVIVDPADVAALWSLPGVVAVTRVGDYQASQATSVSAATQAEVATLIGADEVRRRGNDGAGVEIAVVDTGMDYTHVKLGGGGDQAAYRRAACGDPALAPGDPGCDATMPPPADLFPNQKVAGGLDLVGDVWPASDPRCGTAQVCAFSDLNPIDLNGHGTHVADLIAGLPTAPGGTDVGVAPGARIWAFKACNSVVELCNGVALLSAIDTALDLDRSDYGECTAGAACRAYDPADVIVLALGYSYGQPEDAVTLFADLAGFYGSLVVAAAGNDGDKPYVIAAPATADAALAVAESTIPRLGQGEAVAASASRGPRIADNAMKPDLASPGAIVSAQAGGGAAVTPFGGSSGAAPVVAGVAALLIQELEEKGALDPGPGLGSGVEPDLSLAPLVKAVLMNNARGDLLTAAGDLAPYTLQGAGRVSAIGSFVGRTLALDATEMIALLNSSPELSRCTVTPYEDLIVYLQFQTSPPCAALYPGGDSLYRAWNAQTGSVSFGYSPAVATQALTRYVVVQNYSRSPRSYSLRTALRSADDQGRGVALRVAPERLELNGGAAQVVTLTVTVSPAELRDWTLNGGELGNQGSASCASPTPEQDCPSLSLFEIEGALVIDGGANNLVSVPVHILPRKVAAMSVSSILADRVELSNGPAPIAGVVEPFALFDISPNKCDSRDGRCESVDYTPGDLPGLGQSPVDLNYVGLRSYASPGLNDRFQLPPAPAGALADEVVEFAITVHDKPYRASPNVPAQFQIHLDADSDGVVDYVVYNADQASEAARSDGPDGRSAVFVRDVNAIDGTRPTRFYFYSRAGFNSQVWVLPVPAAAIGLQSDRPFRFYVQAFDSYFQKSIEAGAWDCSPGSLDQAQCGPEVLTGQTGALRFRPVVESLSVPPESYASLLFTEDVGGAAGSPSQLGLLLLFRDAQPGREAAVAQLR